VVVAESPRVTGTRRVPGASRYVHPLPPFLLQRRILLTTVQAKGGFKTRRKHNVNRWVVTPRERNMGKRRSKKGSSSKA
jgi:hypothetical protein